MKKMTDGNFNNENGDAARRLMAALMSPDADQKIKAELCPGSQRKRDLDQLNADWFRRLRLHLCFY